MTSSAAGIVVRPATRADLPALSDLMAEAFVDTPIFRFLQPDDRTRRPLIRAWFAGLIRHGYPVVRAGMVADDGSGPVGGAIWAPPGAWRVPWWRELLTLPRIVVAADRTALRGFAARGTDVDRAMHAAHPAAPHWYLAALGVAPTVQRQGVGTALLRAGLDRCRAEDMPTYLECREALLGYYGRFGFSPLRRVGLPDGAPAQFGMWREP